MGDAVVHKLFGAHPEAFPGVEAYRMGLGFNIDLLWLQFLPDLFDPFPQELTAQTGTALHRQYPSHMGHAVFPEICPQIRRHLAVFLKKICKLR